MIILIFALVFVFFAILIPLIQNANVKRSIKREESEWKMQQTITESYFRKQSTLIPGGLYYVNSYRTGMVVSKPNGTIPAHYLPFRLELDRYLEEGEIKHLSCFSNGTCRLYSWGLEYDAKGNIIENYGNVDGFILPTIDELRFIRLHFQEYTKMYQKIENTENMPTCGQSSFPIISCTLNSQRNGLLAFDWKTGQILSDEDPDFCRILVLREIKAHQEEPVFSPIC